MRGSLDEGTQGLYLYVNPYADDSESRDAREEWNAVHLASLRNPTAISYADISKNGFNDGTLSLASFLCSIGLMCVRCSARH